MIKGVSRVFFEFAVPAVGIIFLIVAPLVGWQKQVMRIEESRRNRVKAHSTERAMLLAKGNFGSQTVTISGVVLLNETVLIGYRKSSPSNVYTLAPGENIDTSGIISGTWVVWLKPTDNLDIEKLQYWCKSKVTVVFTVDPQGTESHLIEPLTLDEVKIQLAPS